MTTKELIDFENKYMLGTRGNRFLIVVDDEIVLKDFYDFKNEIKMPLYYGRIKSEGEYLLTHRKFVCYKLEIKSSKDFLV